MRGVERADDREAGIEIEPGIAQLHPHELDRPAGLAENELRGGDVDGAAAAHREHRVEASGGDVGGGDRERADDAQPVRLALQRRDAAQHPAGIGRLDADHLEPLLGEIDAKPSVVHPGALAAGGVELVARAEVMDEAEADVGHRAAVSDGD
ncbi:MAG: hypothetical protein M9964_04340 [Solirubrobacterales bacterium]|nr:hypothetical protein [Solirubrobacterales bacterium]